MNPQQTHVLNMQIPKIDRLASHARMATLSLLRNLRVCLNLFPLLSFTVFLGCAGHSAEKQNNSFFTSGSKEADQRASQRMAKAEQLSGEGEAGGEETSK